MMGDTIFLIPAIKNIKSYFPDAHITFICSPTGHTISKYIKEIDETIVYNFYHPFWAKKQLKKKLKNNSFDYFFNYDTSDDYKKMFNNLIKTKLKYEMTSNSEQINDFSVIQKSDTHAVVNYLNLAKKANIPIKINRYSIRIPDQIKRLALAFKTKKNNSGQTALIGFHCGNHTMNTNTTFKKKEINFRSWSINNYIDMAILLSKKYNIKIILTGSFFERKATNIIEKELKKKAIPVLNMAGKTKSMKSFLKTLLACDLFFLGIQNQCI